MAVPANPGSVMELDLGGENVSFLIRVVPHPHLRRFLELLQCDFICHSGPDDERLVAKIYESFWWTDNVVVPVQLGSETAEVRRVAVAAHERRRVSKNFKVHAYICHSFPYRPSVFYAPSRV